MTEKYDALKFYFKKLPENQTEVILSIKQIELILNNKLPKSAYRDPVWWNSINARDVWSSVGWDVESVYFDTAIKFIRKIDHQKKPVNYIKTIILTIVLAVLFGLAFNSFPLAQSLFPCTVPLGKVIAFIFFSLVILLLYGSYIGSINFAGLSFVPNKQENPFPLWVLATLILASVFGALTALVLGTISTSPFHLNANLPTVEMFNLNMDGEALEVLPENTIELRKNSSVLIKPILSYKAVCEWVSLRGNNFGSPKSCETLYFPSEADDDLLQLQVSSSCTNYEARNHIKVIIVEP